MDYLKARYGPKGEVYIFKRHIAVSCYIMLYKIMTIVIVVELIWLLCEGVFSL